MAEQFDIIIIGAGLSGIGAAYKLQKYHPDKSYVILEARNNIGGTWDLFRYPGIRSDSDMFTLGYGFKPWRGGKLLADGPAIRNYVIETAQENGIEQHIRFGQRMQNANWDSESASWTVATGDHEYRGNMLLTCAGYYSYQHPHIPDFACLDDFEGQFFHPQFWPEDLDYAGKKVVVIGSGATAVSLIPALAKNVAHVTMLQRSPTYYGSRGKIDKLGVLVGKVLPEQTAYDFVRWKNAMIQRFIYGLSRIWPAALRWILLRQARVQLGEGFDIETDFTPSYNPWDERLCALDENDLYKAFKSGSASIVTDEIDHFVANGIKLKSGKTIEADIAVAATGLEMAINGEADLMVDGKPITLSDTWSYKGLMYSGIPNLINTFGYINASWTLRADLIADFACQVIDHMKRTNTKQVTPVLRPGDADMPERPWIDDFQSGYMQRGLPKFPKQGDREPWINSQNYRLEKKTIGKASLDDGVLTFK